MHKTISNGADIEKMNFSSKKRQGSVKRQTVYTIERHAIPTVYGSKLKSKYTPNTYFSNNRKPS